jgi:adenosine deaminase
MLPSHFSHHVLRAPAQLGVYARFVQSDGKTARWTQLDQQLLDAVENDPHTDDGHRSLHQLHGARALFSERRSRHAPDAPLVVTALCLLARELLVFHRGELMFRPEGHLRWREVWSASTLIEPIRAAATALSCLQGDPVDRWWPRPARDHRSRQLIDAAPVLPPVADPQVLQMRDQGLVELHRHDSLSRLPTSMWLALLHAEAPPLEEATQDRLDLNLLVRQARALTRAIDRLLDQLQFGEPCPPSIDSPSLVQSTETGSAVTAAWTALEGPRAGFRPPEETPLGDPWLSDIPPSARVDARLALDRERMEATLRILMAPDHPGPAACRDALGLAFHAWLICRHHLETAVVMPPDGARGLDRFKRRYVDHPWMRQALSSPSSRWRQAWRVGGVQEMEVKTGPGGGLASKARAWLDALAESESAIPPDDPTADNEGWESWRARGLIARLSMRTQAGAHSSGLARPDSTRQRPGVRLVLHFLRQPEPTPPPRGVLGPTIARHGALRDIVMAQAAEFRTVLDDDELGRLYVGIDIASNELAAPAEVFAAAFRRLRAPWALSQIRHGSAALAMHSLGVSVHAGEEFEHIIGGMRQVDEHLRFLNMGRSDRLGHALALGLDPAQWRQQCNGGVTQRRQGRLDDLIWLHHKLSTMPQHAHLCHRLRNEAAILSQRIYGTVFDPASMYEAWTLRDIDPAGLHTAAPAKERVDGTDWSRAAQGGPSPDPLRAPEYLETRKRLARASAQAREVLHRYLFDLNVRRLGREHTEVPDDRSLDRPLRDLQTQMLHNLAMQDIAIEANPSSNLAISSIERIADHPIFRWLPVRPEDRGGVPMPRVCIGSDDPAVFSTELAHEYALLAEAARQEGHSPRDVREWLGELRRNAEQLAFPYA